MQKAPPQAQSTPHLSDCMKFRVSDDRLRTVEEVGTCITGIRAHGAVNDEIELLLAGACLAQLRIQVQSIHAHLYVPYSSESQRTPRTNHRLRNVHASFSSNEYVNTLSFLGFQANYHEQPGTINHLHITPAKMASDDVSSLAVGVVRYVSKGERERAGYM